MSHNFNPGDLALVVGGSAFLGKQVELVQFLVRGGLITHKDVEYQLKQDARGDGWAVTDGEQMCVKLATHLMPLRGDFAHEQQKAKEAV